MHNLDALQQRHHSHAQHQHQQERKKQHTEKNQCTESHRTFQTAERHKSTNHQTSSQPQRLKELTPCRHDSSLHTLMTHIHRADAGALQRTLSSSHRPSTECTDPRSRHSPSRRPCLVCPWTRPSRRKKPHARNARRTKQAPSPRLRRCLRRLRVAHTRHGPVRQSHHQQP
jgi:hypothetical protein